MYTRYGGRKNVCKEQIKKNNKNGRRLLNGLLSKMTKNDSINVYTQIVKIEREISEVIVD